MTDIVIFMVGSAVFGVVLASAFILLIATKGTNETKA